ncbi:MAG: branched-chain amino acid ABC transporter substrate-binding protein, partial [Sinomicrobium sp.]|nr:branched-chain amino acid ABC transporter substrate-binding protein [Sinomicrobium sp.]
YAMDFYSGALMAIDSVKKLGLSVNVSVFDTEGDKTKIDQLLVFNDFTHFHAVIGPFYSVPFNTLSEALKADNVPVIAPLTNKNIELYANVFQTVPTEEYLRERMIDFMVNHAEGKHIIIVTDNKNAALIKKLQSRFPGAQTVIPEKDRTVTLYQLSKRLSEEKENWVLLETESEALIANVTSVLNSINKEKYRITLLTTYKADAFDSDNISNVHLSNLAFHYPTIDKLSLVNSSFSKQYEAEFYTTPSRYAIRGFDITFDVLLRLAYSGDLYKAARNVGETAYVENKFDYTRKFLGGYYNKAYYIVKYDNLEIKEVEQ